MEGKLRIVELFAGIGAQAMALEQLGIPYESTVCEIDRNAYASYCAIHGDTPIWVTSRRSSIFRTVT